jgi:hypothetical protein
MHRGTPLLLHPPERLLDLLVELVILAIDILFRLRVGRLKLHL